jgi:hypothetical protein
MAEVLMKSRRGREAVAIKKRNGGEEAVEGFLRPTQRRWYEVLMKVNQGAGVSWTMCFGGKT